MTTTANPPSISALVDAAVRDFWNGMFSPSHEAGMVLDKIRYHLRSHQVRCSKLRAAVRLPSGHLEIEVTTRDGVVSRSYPPPRQPDDDEKTVFDEMMPVMWDKNHTT